MIIFLIIGTAGIMLGVSFKVLVLVPAILLTTAVITVTGIASDDEAWTIALTVFGTAASLQIGYFAGSILCGMVRAPVGTEHGSLSTIFHSRDVPVGEGRRSPL